MASPRINIGRALLWAATLLFGWITIDFVYAVVHLEATHPAPTLSSVTVDTFRFENYNDTTGNEETNVTAALNKLFPRGTPKAYIDKILVQQDGASEDDRNLAHKSEVLYFHTGSKHIYACAPGWSVRAEFDAALKLTSLNVVGPCVGP